MSDKDYDPFGDRISVVQDPPTRDRHAAPSEERSLREALERLLGAIEAKDEANIHGWAIAVRAAADSRPAEPLREALQAVYDLGDQLDSNHTRWAAGEIADRLGVTIRHHNDLSDPPRNRNEEQQAELQRQLDECAAALALAADSRPAELDVERLLTAAVNVDENMDLMPLGNVWWHAVVAEYTRLSTEADQAETARDV